MSDQRGPWSVKGIDERAREAARLAARQRGMTLGEYLNDLLIEEPEAARAARPKPTAEASYAEDMPQRMTSRLTEMPGSADALARLTQRIEAVEAKSALAITGIDQSVIGLVRRLENAEAGNIEVVGHVDHVLDDVRKTHEALQGKIAELESDDTATRSLEALRSLEGALGKLAAHVYEENELAQSESEAIKARVEGGFSEVNERVEGIEVRIESTLAEATKRVEKAVESAELRTEGSAKHLSERFTALEEKVAAKMARVDDVSSRMDHVESDVSGALTSMEGLMTRIQQRLNTAEETTNGAMRALETTFDALDRRIDAVAAQASPQKAEALREQFEERFESLAASLQASVEKARAELADEIERTAAAVNPDAVVKLQNQLGEVFERVETSEARQARAIEDVAADITKLGTSLEQRVSMVEQGGSGNVAEAVTEVARQQIARLTAEVDARLQAVEAREAGAIGKVGDHVGDLAGRMEKRIMESEHRSAKAIEQVGEQVAGVATRLKHRQDDIATSISSHLEEHARTQDEKLNETLDRVTQRMERAHEEARQTISPVRKAMASLVTRIEALEDGRAPCGAQDAGGDDAPKASVKDFAARMAATETRNKRPADTFSEGLDLTRLDNWRDGLDDDDDKREVADASAPFGQAADTDPLPPEPAFDDAVKGLEIDPLDELEGERESGFAGADDPHGGEEVRDRDIFAREDDFESVDLPDFDAQPTGESDDTDEALLHPVGDDEIPDDWEVAPDGLPPVETVVEEVEREDYLARARRAAKAASAESAASFDAPRLKARVPKVGKPVMIAASAIAVAAVAGGGVLYLRGKSDDAVSASNATVETPVMPVAQAEVTVSGESGLPASGGELSGAQPDDVEAELFAEVTATETNAPTTPAPIAAEPLPSEAEIVETAPVERPQPVSAPAPVRAPIEVPSIERAARSGDRIAQYQLGVEALGEGRVSEGVGLIEASARSGLPIAQYRLSKLYENGTGLPRDIAEARRWTDRAAKGGNVKAMHDLAVFFAEGEGGSQSYAEASVWFRRAAEFGVVDSQFNLAVLYEQGLGVSPDPEQALFWYEVAQRNGDEMAGSRARGLDGQLSRPAIENTRRRAAAFEAKTPLTAPNGVFPPQAWERDSTTSNPVGRAQELLTTLGYRPGPVDGVMGERTRNAIMAFQRSVGQSPTGVVDSALLSSLQEAIGGDPSMASMGLKQPMDF